jgi:pimeloyl-ACP methyl ester carboxylesterase
MTATAALTSEGFVNGSRYTMYVQTWAPVSTPESELRPAPLILIHGGAHTGICWTSTPDRRPGWARQFAAHGWSSYVIDWPGVGRSGCTAEFLTMGLGPVLDALHDLLSRAGPAVLVGHSMGAAIAFKLADLAPDLVQAVVALNCSPIGNVPVRLSLRPLESPIRFERDAVLRIFANADRFPSEALADYLASLVPMSPSIENALGDRGDRSLWIERPDMVRQRPILFVTGDQDQLAIAPLTKMIAATLQIQHIQTADDWGQRGFGHMIPIERGSEAILERVIAWLNSKATVAA